jgi:hypothetical protein
LSIKDIIESTFDISTTTLPASRIHAPGGTLERKVADGYDVLEVAKGTWVEAIFAKKREPMEKLRFISENEYDEDGNTNYGYTIEVPLAASISANQKASRILNDVKFTARLAGAIHVVNIVGSLTYENLITGTNS